MKRLLAGLFTLFLFFLTLNSATAQQQNTTDKPKILGVSMYAEWCGNCKQLDPKLSEVKPQFENQPILFIQFDKTNDFTISQSKKMANMLGLSGLYQEHEGRTGYVVLLDAQSNEVLKTLTSDQSEEKLKQEIESVL